MGVQGLWQLLQPVARPIKLETLEGKRLAIDSSIWLYHFQMAMRDKEGRTLSNAHILGFLWRILKLLFHGIRPVFVFDGGAPVMKSRTLTNRKARKQGAKESHSRTAEKLLAAQLRHAAIKHVAEGRTQPSDQTDAAAGLDDNTVYFDDLQQARPQALTNNDLQGYGSPSRTHVSSSQNASRNASPDKSGSPSKGRKPDWHRDPYALPELDRDLNALSAQNGKKGKRADYRFATEGELRAVMSTIAPEDLDTESELFRSLPPELQYELVGDLRAQSRMTSYKRLQSMLATAPTPIDFSRAQIAGLRTRNDLTQKVLTVTDEIGSANIKVPLRVAGERNKEYVLVRNLGAESGFVLGVRDSGTTVEKAINVDEDHERLDTTDDDQDQTDPEAELEMDEVEIPPVEASDTSADRIDPEVAALRSEADPVRRKEKALEILQMRAKQHARQARKEAGLNVDDYDARPRAARKLSEKPLFIRDAGTSGVDAIDLDADDDDKDGGEDGYAGEGNACVLDEELAADEAENLSRALKESERDRSAAPQQLCGFGLSSRRGEPISLHTAMRASNEPKLNDTIAPLPAERSVSRTSLASTEVAGKEQSLNPVGRKDDEDIEFEDVDVPAVANSSMARHATSAPAPVPSRPLSSDGQRDAQAAETLLPAASPESSRLAAESDRMKQLAALVNRAKRGLDAAPAPPRKSLAGSLRAVRLSPSSKKGQTLIDPGTTPPKSRATVDSPDRAKTQNLVSGPTTPIERKGAMGPPTRSASQQRLGIKASPSGPPESPSPAVARTSSDDGKSVLVGAHAVSASAALQPRTTSSPRQAPLASTTDLAVSEAQSSIAAGAGIDDGIEEAVEAARGEPSNTSASSENADLAAVGKGKSPLAARHSSSGKEPTPSAGPLSPGVGRQTGLSSSTAKAAAGIEPIEVGSSPPPMDQLESTDHSPERNHLPTPQPIALDNVPAATAETAAPAEPIRAPSPPDSRDGTPFEWSPSPSPEPVVLGADGFPLPTAEELEAMDAEDEEEIARLNADQNEFAAFLSASKGRSLFDVQQEVENEVNALWAEHVNSRKSEEDITRQMAQEIQMMLRLFGLPYITAPMEAEAQCAELVSRRLVDGIITDDSDVFLFGGTRIYKNMFNNNRVVECFLLSDLQRELGLDREKLVRLAYFLGSDYTEGLAGVGPVLAMELLALFSGQDGLLKFREWWYKVQMGKDSPEDTRGKTMRRIKKALRNKVHLAPSWPEPEVLDAYYQPTVDESDEPFQWGLPDLDSLRTFLGEYLHWPVTKTDQYLLPIIEKQNQRSRARGNQSTLDRNGFFDTTAGLGVYAGRKKPTYGSNRLQEVVNGFRAATKSKAAGAASAGDDATSARASSKGRGGRHRRVHRRGATDDEATSSEEDVDDSSSSSSDGIEVVEANLQAHVPEELLGKEMAKRRPIVRRDELGTGAAASTKEDRLAALDAAVEALKGQRPDATAARTAKKPRKAPTKDDLRGTKRSKDKDKAKEAEAATGADQAAGGEADGGDSSSSADEWRPQAKRGRGRGQG